jgi:hypothetical protein
MYTLVVHAVALEDGFDLEEASVQTSFLNSGNEILRIGPDDRVVPWYEIEKAVAAAGEDQAIVVRRISP